MKRQDSPQKSQRGKPDANNHEQKLTIKSNQIFELDEVMNLLKKEKLNLTEFEQIIIELVIKHDDYETNHYHTTWIINFTQQTISKATEIQNGNSNKRNNNIIVSIKDKYLINVIRNQVDPLLLYLSRDLQIDCGTSTNNFDLVQLYSQLKPLSQVLKKIQRKCIDSNMLFKNEQNTECTNNQSSVKMLKMLQQYFRTKWPEKDRRCRAQKFLLELLDNEDTAQQRQRLNHSFANAFATLIAYVKPNLATIIQEYWIKANDLDAFIDLIFNDTMPLDEWGKEVKRFCAKRVSDICMIVTKYDGNTSLREIKTLIGKIYTDNLVFGYANNDIQASIIELSQFFDTFCVDTNIHDEKIDDFQVDDAYNCTLHSCHSINNIANIMRYYQTVIGTEDSNDAMWIYINKMYLDGNYHSIQLHNDFEHIKDKHNTNDRQFEMVYTMLIILIGQQKCSLHNCGMAERNYENECNQTALQQYLESIHCYFFHSYDRGWRLTTKQLEKLRKMNKDSDEFNINDYQNLFNQEHGHDIQKQSKFTTFVENDEKKECSEGVYSFGVRYYYWDYYENNTNEKEGWQEPGNDGYRICDWYVKPKYALLKDEVTNKDNPQGELALNLSIDQWKELLKIANDHLESEKGKQFICDGLCPIYEDYWKNRYGFGFGDRIQLPHIIAVLLYTNYTTYQNKFSKTYRKMNFHESDHSLKLRHTLYANMGRLLREAVECFGERIGGTHYNFVTERWVYKEKKPFAEEYSFFYHGIDKEMLFNSTIASFKGPTSTSVQCTQAMIYAEKRGLILGLQQDSAFLKYFDCWMSCYSYEDENLFIGGQFAIEFGKIIEIKTAKKNKDIMIIMKLLNWILRGSKLRWDNSNGVIKIIEKYKCANNNDQSYCARLWRHYVQNIRVIQLSLRRMTQASDCSEDSFSQKYLFEKNEHCSLWIRLDQICELFPNCNKITIECMKCYDKDYSVTLCDYFFERLMDCECIKYQSNLKEIIFCGDLNQSKMTGQEAIKKYHWNFKINSWNLCFKNDRKKNNYVFSVVKM